MARLRRPRRNDRRGNSDSCRTRHRTSCRGCAVNIRESLFRNSPFLGEGGKRSHILILRGGKLHSVISRRASEYNNLKRAVAAATSGVYQSVQHVGQSHPPMPPFRHAQSADPFSFPTMARPAAPPRTASAGHLVTPQPIRAAQVTRSTRSNANTPPPPRSTLTPSLARVNLEFSLNAQPTTSSTPVQVEQKSAAEKTVKETILDDLVEGEPVSVERTPTKVVVSETLPTPAVAQESQTTPSIHGLLPGMQIMNGVPVKTSVSHPIK